MGPAAAAPNPEMLIQLLLSWCYPTIMSTIRIAASAATALFYWSQPASAGSLADIDHVVLFMQGMCIIAFVQGTA